MLSNLTNYFLNLIIEKLNYSFIIFAPIILSVSTKFSYPRSIYFTPLTLVYPSATNPASTKLAPPLSSFASTIAPVNSPSCNSKPSTSDKPYFSRSGIAKNSKVFNEPTPAGLEKFAFEWNGLRKFELKQFKKG